MKTFAIRISAFDFSFEIKEIVEAETSKDAIKIGIDRARRDHCLADDDLNEVAAVEIDFSSQDSPESRKAYQVILREYYKELSEGSRC